MKEKKKKEIIFVHCFLFFNQIVLIAEHLLFHQHLMKINDDWLLNAND